MQKNDWNCMPDGYFWWNDTGWPVGPRSLNGSILFAMVSDRSEMRYCRQYGEAPDVTLLVLHPSSLRWVESGCPTERDGTNVEHVALLFNPKKCDNAAPLPARDRGRRTSIGDQI